MSELLAAILASVGVTGLAGYLARNWLTERLRQSIKHEYDEKIERLKSQLSGDNTLSLERFKSEIAREASVLAVAHRTLEESAAIAQRRRVDGVSELWNALLTIRNNSPEVFTFLDVLLPEEHSKLNTHKFKTFNPDISTAAIQVMVGDKTKTIETVRPFVGEYLWFLFFVYQAIHLRIAFLHTNNRSKNSYTPWYSDSTTLNLLKSAASSMEIEDFNRLRVGQINAMRQLIEGKFLAASEKILSGQTSGTFAAEEAARMAKAVLELGPETDSARGAAR